jgi:L-alanine-DL-glutamate epimerase-like enolase superfamily enzyme
MQALSAVDIAWWDLKARLLNTSVTELAGQVRSDVPFYGSGGFTSLDDRQLQEQVASWAAVGATAMKIKIGENRGTAVARDLARVRRLAELAGPNVTLMVDANGGYRHGQALRVGRALDELGVEWFEEPVTSDDPGELALLRAQLSCDVTAGEYAAEVDDVRALLPAVDCLQLDATRCGGFTGFLRAAALAQSEHLDVSGHCAPALHSVIGSAVPNLRHVEYFVDHVRVESRLIDGVPAVGGGVLRPDPARPGHGMTVRSAASW